jgi:hypothetical protein
MSGVLKLLPHDMGLRVELDTNETYYLKSGWIGCCDGIYGLAVSYTDGSGIGHVSFLGDPAPIAIMNSHVKLAVPFDDHETKTTKQSEDVKRRLTNCMITAVTSSTITMSMACLTSGAKATSSRSALSCSSAMRD